MELHQVIRQAREQAGMTLTEAAQRRGVGKATLSRLETNKGPITATRLTEVARLYGVSPSGLFEGTVAPSPSDDGDYTDVGVVVEEVERLIAEADVRPPPEKVSDAVVEILKLARADLRSGVTSEFDVRRYRGVAKAMLR